MLIKDLRNTFGGCLYFGFSFKVVTSKFFFVQWLNDMRVGGPSVLHQDRLVFRLQKQCESVYFGLFLNVV